MTHQHPVGPGELGVHADDVALLVVDLLEDLVAPLGGEHNLLLVLEILIGLLPLGSHLETNSPYIWLIPRTQ